METLKTEQVDRSLNPEGDKYKESFRNIKKEIKKLVPDYNANGKKNAAYQYVGIDFLEDGIASSPILLKAWSAGKRTNAISIYHGRDSGRMNSDRNINIRTEYTLNLDNWILETNVYSSRSGGEIKEHNAKKLDFGRPGMNDEIPYETKAVLKNFEDRINEAAAYRNSHMQGLAKLESEKMEAKERADSDENSDFLANVENGRVFEGNSLS